MTLPKTVGALSGVLVVMLCVVMLQERIAYVHRDLSRIEQRIQNIRFEIREKELELARLRNEARLQLQAAAEPEPVAEDETSAETD